MAIQMAYAQLHHNTWLYRRTYPRDVQPLLGAALKRSLKTADAKEARQRIAELNAAFDRIVSEARARRGASTAGEVHTLPVALPRHARVRPAGLLTVGELSELYLAQRSAEVRPGTFKTVRRGVQELADLYRVRELGSLTLADGRRVLAELGARSVRGGKGGPLSSTTRAHLWAAIRQFLAWAVAEGHLETDPFSGLEGPRVKHESYAVMSDAEVRLFLRQVSSQIRPILLTCLLTGHHPSIG